MSDDLQNQMNGSKRDSFAAMQQGLANLAFIMGDNPDSSDVEQQTDDIITDGSNTSQVVDGKSNERKENIKTKIGSTDESVDEPREVIEVTNRTDLALDDEWDQPINVDIESKTTTNNIKKAIQPLLRKSLGDNIVESNTPLSESTETSSGSINARIRKFAAGSARRSILIIDTKKYQKSKAMRKRYKKSQKVNKDYKRAVSYLEARKTLLGGQFSFENNAELKAAQVGVSKNISKILGYRRCKRFLRATRLNDDKESSSTSSSQINLVRKKIKDKQKKNRIDIPIYEPDKLGYGKSGFVFGRSARDTTKLLYRQSCAPDAGLYFHGEINSNEWGKRRCSSFSFSKQTGREDILLGITNIEYFAELCPSLPVKKNPNLQKNQGNTL